MPAALSCKHRMIHFQSRQSNPPTIPESILTRVRAYAIALPRPGADARFAMRSYQVRSIQKQETWQSEPPLCPNNGRADASPMLFHKRSPARVMTMFHAVVNVCGEFGRPLYVLCTISHLDSTPRQLQRVGITIPDWKSEADLASRIIPHNMMIR